MQFNYHIFCPAFRCQGDDALLNCLPHVEFLSAHFVADAVTGLIALVSLHTLAPLSSHTSSATCHFELIKTVLPHVFSVIQSKLPIVFLDKRYFSLTFSSISLAKAHIIDLGDNSLEVLFLDIINWNYLFIFYSFFPHFEFINLTW